MVRVTQDAFLNAFTKMLEKSKDSGNGSVQVSFKRYEYTEDTDKNDKGSKGGSKKNKGGDHEVGTLIRARLGNDKKSTIVQFKDHVRFQQQFALIMKVHADGLKKRSKEKTIKQKRKTRGTSERKMSERS